MENENAQDVQEKADIPEAEHAEHNPAAAAPEPEKTDPGNEEADAGQDKAEPKAAPDPHAARNTLLDAMSEPDPNAPQAKTEPKPEPEPKPKALPDDKAEKKAEPTPDQEEAEMLEGVKSERGRERIKTMMAGNRQLKADIHEFREMVVNTGMSPDQFAQTLEYGRLTSSNNEADKHVALAMLDAARAELVQELGIEAPGVDPLADFKDLTDDVENMGITRERAIELAKYRRRDALAQKGTQAQQTREAETKEFQGQIDQAATIAENYFKTRETETDYPAKMKLIHEWFANEKNKQEFVTTYQPKQWFGFFKMMYDNIKVIQPNGARPISSRTPAMGAPRNNEALDTQSKMLQKLESMGI